MHQPTPELKYNFEGDLNLFNFLKLAHKNDLLVILRPGPFIDAERDMVIRLCSIFMIYTFGFGTCVMFKHHVKSSHILFL